MLRLDPSTPPLTWGEVFVDGDWCPGSKGGGLSPTVTSAQDNLPAHPCFLPASLCNSFLLLLFGREEGCELGFSDCLGLLFFCHFSVPRCEYEYARGPSSTAAPSQEVGNRCLLSFTNFKGPTNSVLFWLEPLPWGLTLTS